MGDIDAAYASPLPVPFTFSSRLLLGGCHPRERREGVLAI